MNYEIAKKLKDEGFPQGESAFVYVGDNQIPFLRYDAPRDSSYGEYIDIPTLSELIKACGNFFISVEKKIWGWSAFGEKSYTEEYTEKGTTPEEAVANLWLALNSKSVL